VFEFGPIQIYCAVLDGGIRVVSERYNATAAQWFSSFLLNAFVSRVNRRMPIRMLRFDRSTKLVLTYSAMDSPKIGVFSVDETLGGEYLPGPMASVSYDFTIYA
jgi:hypothetical protein